MPTFVLIRHAKADRPRGVADLDRPLADRGRHDAGLLGRFLGKSLAEPTTVLSSPAARARDTAEIVLAAARWSTAIAVDERMYHGGVQDLLALLRAARGPLVLAFGHEPVWSAAVTTLTGGGGLQMVTAAAVGLDGTAEPGGAALLWMVTPTILGGGRR